MTTPANKARKFADAAVELGWTVLKKKAEDGTLFALCSRDDERYNLSWTPGARGLVFDGGWHWVGEEAEEITSPAAALKAMSAPAKLDLNTASDKEVIDYIAGRLITWENSISGTLETARVPKRTESLKTAITTTTVTRRILTFVIAEGYRSVGLDAITEVK